MKRSLTWSRAGSGELDHISYGGRHHGVSGLAEWIFGREKRSRLALYRLGVTMGPPETYSGAPAQQHQPHNPRQKLPCRRRLWTRLFILTNTSFPLFDYFRYVICFEINLALESCEVRREREVVSLCELVNISYTYIPAAEPRLYIQEHSISRPRPAPLVQLHTLWAANGNRPTRGELFSN